MTALLIVLLVYHLAVGLSMVIIGFRGAPMLVLHGAATVALVSISWWTFLS